MKRSLWWYFPQAIVAGLGVVVAVNAGMVYAALHSFPGQAGDEGFELSNHYDAVLEREQRVAALGWTVAARTDAAGRPEVRLTDRDGSPLHGASVAASAERPLGAPQTRPLAFHEIAAGSYIADVTLPTPGQWELTLTASLGGHDMAATRRVIVH
ncbi:MAG TPA: FixH family protein [Acetobacteraceae bacterium]|jgi:nitrogen fixation protein FixH